MVEGAEKQRPRLQMSSGTFGTTTLFFSLSLSSRPKGSLDDPQEWSRLQRRYEVVL